LGNLSGFIKTFNRYNIIECTLREHSIIMNYTARLAKPTAK
jgi:hypothetical protein